MLNSATPAPLPLLKTRSRYALAFILLCIFVVLSLTMGAKPIPLAVVYDSFFGTAQHPDSIIVLESRLPRTLLGLFAGAALGLAGALIQALTRNPLADPGLLGVNAGASFAVVLAVALFNIQQPASFVGFACAGALITTLLVYFIGVWGVGRLDPSRFILAGVAIGAVMHGISSGLVLFNPMAFDRIRYWNAGTLDVRNLNLVLMILPAMITGSVLALLLARPLNALSMGAELSITLGTRPWITQAFSILAITLLTGATTAIAGPIGFVGLMIPQVARWLVGPDQRRILPLTILLAPILLLGADMVGRLLVPGELRVSIVTAFVGAPMLIWLARKQVRT
ncbi:Fe(3+)-siderophore ABC transporter permease [Iodobacter fluviatilis]|uniref:Ferric enterobactin transport system permease protein fepD n=1 Tax=Iodobacter fluviatilis TaxID=537 RepID=A0A377SUH7_9NEIS|nr:Fe(3+)-siderophore ABC transporter permease [Iodobacter fluviatilis]TCU86242.1 iron complex transport system permease protein [Iodobacter fluviatilis]STR44653.1 Ferric enterobactin transport system permease protein fepD [Iodobacter fluviatilis]